MTDVITPAEHGEGAEEENHQEAPQEVPVVTNVQQIETLTEKEPDAQDDRLKYLAFGAIGATAVTFVTILALNSDGESQTSDAEVFANQPEPAVAEPLDFTQEQEDDMVVLAVPDIVLPEVDTNNPVSFMNSTALVLQESLHASDSTILEEYGFTDEREYVAPVLYDRFVDYSDNPDIRVRALIGGERPISVEEAVPSGLKTTTTDEYVIGFNVQLFDHAVDHMAVIDSQWVLGVYELDSSGYPALKSVSFHE